MKWWCSDDMLLKISISSHIWGHICISVGLLAAAKLHSSTKPMWWPLASSWWGWDWLQDYQKPLYIGSTTWSPRETELHMTYNIFDNILLEMLFVISGLIKFQFKFHYIWTIRSQLQWNLNKNTKLFIHKNAFENVCEMAAILSRGEMGLWMPVAIAYIIWYMTTLRAFHCHNSEDRNSLDMQKHGCWL